MDCMYINRANWGETGAVTTTEVCAYFEEEESPLPGADSGNLGARSDPTRCCGS